MNGEESMTKEKLYCRLEEQILIFDGAMGTMLMDRGFKIGQCPEGFNLEHPDIVGQIHREYVKAGADIIQTNTFGGNAIRLKNFHMESKLIEINQRAVDIALKAAGGRCFVAGNIGPVGQPWNDIRKEQIYKTFYEQGKILIDEGVELISIETMTDLREAAMAVKAMKEIKDIPVICSMSFVKGLKTLDGSTPEMAVMHLTEAGADIIGSNCGSDIQDMLTVMEKMVHAVPKYWSVKPNAGSPKKIGNQILYPLSPEDMANYSRRFVELGVNVIGGCCGTTPAHIQGIREAVGDME
jgi:5-methyltetrahydrofolate--homocysteine methyltransferase